MRVSFVILALSLASVMATGKPPSESGDSVDDQTNQPTDNAPSGSNTSQNNQPAAGAPSAANPSQNNPPVINVTPPPPNGQPSNVPFWRVVQQQGIAPLPRAAFPPSSRPEFSAEIKQEAGGSGSSDFDTLKSFDIINKITDTPDRSGTPSPPPPYDGAGPSGSGKDEKKDGGDPPPPPPPAAGSTSAGSNCKRDGSFCLIGNRPTSTASSRSGASRSMSAKGTKSKAASRLNAVKGNRKVGKKNW